ncbi:hypothetical protein C8Q72DRAFT_208967 [Fomitopsis betulina]|nr:hypothetical protein C8Q72DRAFT_208967 [Fomitopsis betulina]
MQHIRVEVIKHTGMGDLRLHRIEIISDSNISVSAIGREEAAVRTARCAKPSAKGISMMVIRIDLEPEFCSPSNTIPGASEPFRCPSRSFNPISELDIMLASAARVFLLIPFVAGAHIDRARVHRQHVGSEANATSTAALARRQSYDNARFTWYKVGLGACGQTNAPSDYIVALDAALYDTGSHCLAAITISYNGKTAQATIADRCEGCPIGGLDLSAGLFQYFTDGDLGADPLMGSWWYGSGSSETTTSAAPTSETPPPTTTSSYSPPPETSTTSETPSSVSSSSQSSSSVVSTSTTSASASARSTAAATQTASAPASAVPSAALELINQAVVGIAGIIVAGARAH